MNGCCLVGRRLAEEMAFAVTVIKAYADLGPRMRFVSVGLHEPDKAQVLAYRAGDAIERRCDVILLDNADGRPGKGW